jgi:uncharacterized RDD family membrane protein YckC
MQGMPMDTPDQMQNTLSEQLGKLDASFTTVFLPAQIIFSAFYYAIPESSKLQGSFGKHLMGIKIVNLNGERISFFRAMARNLVKIIPQYINFFIYIVVYITIPFDKKKRGIHDMLCKTYVVYK